MIYLHFQSLKTKQYLAFYFFSLQCYRKLQSLDLLNINIYINKWINEIKILLYLLSQNFMCSKRRECAIFYLLLLLLFMCSKIEIIYFGWLIVFDCCTPFCTYYLLYKLQRLTLESVINIIKGRLIKYYYYFYYYYYYYYYYPPLTILFFKI